MKKKMDKIICPICKNRKLDSIMGIEDPMRYDGVSWWQCMKCGTKWDRFTKEIIINGKAEKFTITLNKQQLRLVEKVLEDWSRLFSGQLEHIFVMGSPLWGKFYIKCKKEYGKKWMAEFKKQSEDVKYCIRGLKECLYGLGENQSYGVGNDFIPDTSLAYEMYKVINNFFYDREVGKQSVDVRGHKPLNYTKEPFIQIKEEK